MVSAARCPSAQPRTRLGGAEGLVFGSRLWSTFRKGRERALLVAKLDRLHSCRHTFGSWAMQSGATLPELQALLGTPPCR